MKFPVVLSFFRAMRGKPVFTLTAAVSFFAFLSIFPFLLVILSLAASIIRDNQALTYLSKVLDPFPDAVREMLMKTLQGMLIKSEVLGVISFLFLVFAALQMFLYLQHAIHEVMGFPGNGHSRWHLHLRWSTFSLIFLFILFMGVVWGGALLSVLTRLQFIPFFKSRVFIELGYIILDVLFFAVSYIWLTVHRISWRSAFLAGVFVAVCWEVLKYLLGWYISSVNLYSAVYGAIGSLFLFQLWLYYGIFFYLSGAVLGKVLDERRREKLNEKIKARENP